MMVADGSLLATLEGRPPSTNPPPDGPPPSKRAHDLRVLLSGLVTSAARGVSSDIWAEAWQLTSDRLGAEAAERVLGPSRVLIEGTAVSSEHVGEGGGSGESVAPGQAQSQGEPPT
jgi:hypothetical protein